MAFLTVTKYSLRATCSHTQVWVMVGVCMSVWQDGGGVGMEYEWGEGELMMGRVDDEVGLDGGGAEAGRGGARVRLP